MDRPLTSELRGFLLKLTVIMVLATASLTTVAVAIIGGVQANQYQTVVERLDRNAQVSADVGHALTCVLNIEPNDRNPHGNVLACLAKYGLSTDESP